MKEWVLRLSPYPLWRCGDRLRWDFARSISQWFTNRDEPIDRVTPELAIGVIKGVIWRIIINGAIVCLVFSIAIASGYLKFQLPSPNDRGLLFSLAAVGFNLFLTQSLNFQKFTSIILFSLCLGGCLILANIFPAVHTIIMYLYTSWLLLFLVPIFYWLTLAAFDLSKFRNLLIMVAAVASMLVYSVAAMVQISGWQVGFNFLSIANYFSLYTAMICLGIFIFFGIVAKSLQGFLKITLSSLRKAVNQLTINN
jgi:hypothetical protein